MISYDIDPADVSDDVLASQAATIPHKGVVLDASYRTIENPNAQTPATSGPSGGGLQVLSVRFSDGAEEYVHDIPNPGFDPNNPAFFFMAFVDVSPSTIEEARGSFVPIVESDQLPDGKGLGQVVMEKGREKLAESAWGPDFGDEGDQNA